MISPDERREVAERMRKSVGISEFIRSVGIDPDGFDWLWKDVAARVADLIDPTCHVVPSDEESIRPPHCSICGQPILRPWPNYCPHCGARITGVGER